MDMLIFFNHTGKYHVKHYFTERTQAVALALLYQHIVPRIMITNSGDNIVLDVQHGEVTQCEASLLPLPVSPVTIARQDITQDSLTVALSEYATELDKVAKSNSPAYNLARLIDVRVNALACSLGVNLYSHGYRGLDVTVTAREDI